MRGFHGAPMCGCVGKVPVITAGKLLLRKSLGSVCRRGHKEITYFEVWKNFQNTHQLDKDHTKLLSWVWQWSVGGAE